jgi:DNA-binding NarL/FixJ family response regulator
MSHWFDRRSKTRANTEKAPPEIRHHGGVLKAMTRKLLIVDDHASFRSFVRSFLEGDEFEVTGEAGDCAEALAEAERLEPDVVLLDIQLGDGPDGFEVARKLAESAHPPLVVLTSSRDATDYGSRLEEAPVSGFIPKSELSATSLSAVAV